jgi:hypothetical protein
MYVLFVWKKCTEKLIFLQTYWLIVHFGSKFITIKKVLFFLIFDMKIISLNKINCELMLTYDTPVLRQTGSRNLTGQNTLPTIWGTYMKLVIKYQISVINSCWEKCDEKCTYMFNVDKNQLSRQTGSRNLTGPKTLPTIWYTYMMLVTKYQISAINSYWEKCDEKYLGRTEGQTDRGKTVYPPPRGYKKNIFIFNLKYMLKRRRLHLLKIK